MSRRFDHIDLRVRSLSRVRPFYEVMLPALGFTRNDSNALWLEFEYDDSDSDSDNVGGGRVTEYFAVTESPDHRPNDTRIAFWAKSDAPGTRRSFTTPCSSRIRTGTASRSVIG